MMPLDVYVELYRLAKRVPAGAVLEIGAGRGAGTLSLAMGLRDSRKSSKVIAVEKFDGGSNVDFGGKQDNIERIRRLFRRYGVEDRVSLFAEYLKTENFGQLRALIPGDEIAMVVIDADGRLDVHLPLLWQSLARDCPIVLDDYEESRDFRPLSDKYPLGKTKQLTCFRLVNRIVDLGYLKVDRILGHTVFAHRARDGAFTERDRNELRACVEGVRDEYRRWAAAEIGVQSGSGSYTSG